MKRTLAFLLSALLIGFVGCGETSKTEEKKVTETPTGTTTETHTDKVKQTGDNPPPPTGGTDAAAPK